MTWLRPTWLGFGLLGLLVIWVLLAINHPTTSIVSFDEGFHGGSALWQIELVKTLLAGGDIHSADYLRSEFNNGVIFYPPLWNILAVTLGLIFGPSTDVFRFATTIFGLLTLILTFIFTRRFYGRSTGLLSVVILAFLPIFFVYSHLMMLEVPQAFGVTLALVAFYYYLASEKVTAKTIIWTSLAFIVAVQAKVLVIALIFGALSLYGAILLIGWLRTEKQRRRFFAWPTALFILLALGSWYAYIWAVKEYLGADMLGFFLGQSSGISGRDQGLVLGFLDTFWKTKLFYLRDFRHYPLLGGLLTLGLIYRLLIGRQLVDYYLLAWTTINWILFSGIFPQVPQYIIALFIPLSIAAASMIVELTNRVFPARLQVIVLVVLAVSIAGWEYLTLPKSEATGWRTHQTYQQTAADYLASRSEENEAVLVSGDGTLYTVRLAGFAKKLQTYNLTSCPAAVNQTASWAIVESGATEQETRDRLDPSVWQEVRRFQSPNQTTTLYRNPTVKYPLVTEAEQSLVKSGLVRQAIEASGGQELALGQTTGNADLFGCSRLLKQGDRRLDFRLKADETVNQASDGEIVAQLEVWRPNTSYRVTRPLKAGELKNQGYQNFSLEFRNSRLDDKFEFQILVYRKMNLIVDTITFN